MRPIFKYDDRIPLGVTSSILLFFLPHLLILIKILEQQLGIHFEIIRLEGYIFGITIAIIHFTLTYLLFERNNRYRLIIEKIGTAKFNKKITTGVFLVLYFLSPLIIYLIAK